MLKDTNFLSRYRLGILLLVSAFLRLFFASYIELGNDEVYYINYALYPDLSHFDHPPMVGWFIQLFTLNLHFETETWIRLTSVVTGTLNTWLIYLIGKKLASASAGWYSALLYTSSFYGFIIAGTFIMPDSPQMLFWLMTVLFLLNSLESQTNPGDNTSSGPTYKWAWFLLAGLTAGLALLSKYTSAFLLFGTLIYFFHKPSMFRKWYVYAAVLLALLSFLPVIIWNYNNDFISFTFHSERVEITESLFKPKAFLTELAGQVLYNNPVVFILIITGLVAMLRKKLQMANDYGYLLFFIAAPFILLFLGFSLFRSTLPHWTGPAYVTLIPLAGAWISQKTTCGKLNKLFPRAVISALSITAVVLVLALMQFNNNLIFNKGIDPITGQRLGWKDITLDMYGWKQLNKGFTRLYREDLKTGRMDSSAVIISHRWFPAANIDYYVARPNGIKVLTMAPLERTHKYAWITEYRGGFKPGMDAYFISSSYDFEDPHWNYQDYFTIETPDTIPVYRKDLLVKYYYIWRMQDLKKLPPTDYTIPEK